MEFSFDRALQESSHSIRHLILGNGFSINYDQKFNYRSLYERANFNSYDSLKQVFTNLKTSNFEEVITELESTAKVLNVMSAYNDKEYPFINKMLNNADKAKSILIDTIADIHPDKQDAISEHNYDTCRAFLKNFIGNDLTQAGKIFYLNYDLLLYWVIMSDFGNHKNRELDTCDGFYKKTWLINGENVKDQNIFYTHGALHLFDREHFTEKVSYKKKYPLISQIKKLIKNNLYPTFITEGNTESKLKSILQSHYLNYAYSQLNQVRGYVFIVGSSLGDQDDHIWDAINNNRHVIKVFIGVHPSDKKHVINRADTTFSKRDKCFFNINDVSIWHPPKELNF